MSGLGKKCTACDMVMFEVRDGRSETTGEWRCYSGCAQLSTGDEEFAQFVFYHFGGHWLRGDYQRTDMAALPTRIARRVDNLARAKRLAEPCDHRFGAHGDTCVKCGAGAY